MIKRHHQNLKNNTVKEDRVEITFYTDPLCCWSWALQPQLFKLIHKFKDVVSLRLCMGGLIKDWHHFTDPINNISKASQMGPLWMYAAEKTGVPIDEALWVQDPPFSSYPACIAVKTAGLQSPEAGLAYYKLISEFAMVKALNIAKPQILANAAKQLAKEQAHIFNLQHFLTHYNNSTSRAAFRADLQQVRFHNIGRFPTIVMKPAYGKSVITTGYRTYELLLEALEHVTGDNLVES